jgi:nitrogen fixation/metabolism regulation signal transduction histidine kinase
MKNFRLQIILRVVLLAATIGTAFYLAAEMQSYVGAGAVGLVVAFQVWSLIRYADKTNRELARFLRSIRYSDFSQTFSGKRGGPHEELAGALNDVMDDFRKARVEKERQARYLKTIVDHVGVGLLSFDETGQVSLINRAAKKLLGVPRLRAIEDLREISPDLHALLLELPSGQKSLLNMTRDDEERQLSIYASVFRLGSTTYKLVSLQDIQSELESRELEAWQKLTRVLTHEMMNSITPISSMAHTIGAMLEDVPPAAHDRIDEETLEDLQGAAQTIARRSEHLLSFVRQYRQLTRVPEPDRELITVKELFEDVLQLAETDAEPGQVDLQVAVDPAGLEVSADPELLEQVLINLVKNAREAVEDTSRPQVRLEGHIDRQGRSVIRVIDNGTGISPEAREKIFLPFFTTKKEGSGIGLALSKQILRKHGGSLRLDSGPEDEETVFAVRF